MRHFFLAEKVCSRNVCEFENSSAGNVGLKGELQAKYINKQKCKAQSYFFCFSCLEVECMAQNTRPVTEVKQLSNKDQQGPSVVRCEGQTLL